MWYNSITSGIKRIVAAVVAAASIGALSATASAETILDTPVDWCAIYSQGAPSSVNATRYYTIFTYGNGYDITCDYFSGDYNRTVEARKQYEISFLGIKTKCDDKIADLHSTTLSPIYVEHPENVYGRTITFSFQASGNPSCQAYGVINQHY